MNARILENKLRSVDDVIALNPYSSINDEIDIVDCVVDGKTMKLKLDKEFIVIPVEMYGVMNWQGETMNKVLDELLKLSSKQTITQQQIHEIVKIIYNKPQANTYIPSRN